MNDIFSGVRLRRIGVLVAIAMATVLVAWAANAATGSALPATVPAKVAVGLYLNNIPAVNLREKKFQVDFNIWFRWTDAKVQPMDTFKIFNGTIDGKDGLVTKKIGDIFYATQRIQATIYRKFDVDRYPLDNHVLKIQIEDNGTGDMALVYAADKTNSNFSPKMTVPGWVVGKFESYESATTYNTNYGDISLAGNTEARFPRSTFAIEINREGYGFFFKYFSTLFLSALLAGIGYFLHARLIDTRFFLVTSAFFLAVITEGSLASALPETESIGLGILIYWLTQGYIFLTTLLMIFHFNRHTDDGAGRVRQLSLRRGVGLTALYVALTAAVVTGAT